MVSDWLTARDLARIWRGCCVTGPAKAKRRLFAGVP
jgi:hypothetical protein